MSKIFEKIKKSSRITKVSAVVLATVVCVTSIYHGFSDKPLEVNAEDSKKEKQYIQFIVDRMIGGLQKEFTILEIVPYVGMGEFRYYVGDEEINDGIEKNTELMAELKTKSGDWNVSDKWCDLESRMSNFGYTYIHHSATNTYDVQSPKRFLNYVLSEYKEFFEDRINMQTIEANKLTAADIENADFIIVTTGNHDEGTLSLYNAYTNPDVKKEDQLLTVYDDLYNGTVKADGTSDNMTKITTVGDISYNSYQLKDDKYVSCDISWEMVEKLCECTIEGKKVQLSDGSQVNMITPVVVDNKGVASLNKDGNMFKFEVLYRMLNSTQYETVKEYLSTNGNTYINSENIITAELSSTKYFPAMGSADLDLTWTMGGGLSTNEIWQICGDPYNNAEAKAAYKDPYFPQPQYLCDYYWVYKGESCLIPDNVDSVYFNGNSYDTTGFYERVGSPATVADVMRFLLGAKPDPADTIIDYCNGRQIKILEIQPCTDFDYDTYAEVYALGKRLLLDVDGKLTDASGNKKFDALTEANYNKDGANVCIQVECMTSSAFNGINTDIVGEYDAIILGTNDGKLLKDSTGSTIYNDEDLDGYVYLAFGDLIKVKSGISMYYLDDFEAYDKSTMEWLDKRSTAAYYLGYDDASNFRTNGASSAHGTEYRKVYEFNSTTSKLWSPYMASKLTNGKFYLLKNVENQISTLKTNKDWDGLFDDNAGTARLSGNDITSIKYALLKEYVDSGKLLILDDNMATNNSDILYPTSNAAKISQYIIDKGTAANKLLEAKTGQMLLYIRNENPKIDFTDGSQPTEVAYTNGVVSTFNATGTTLPFKFTITGKKNTTYNIAIYVDKNNDGIFYKSDDITNDLNEQFQTGKVNLGDAGKATVSIKAELSENFNGLISYKIEVIEVDASGKELPYRAAHTGYTAIKGDKLKDVKVLQILPVPSNNKSSTVGESQNLSMSTDPTDTLANKTWQKLLKETTEVIGYNIQVETIYTYEYEEIFATNPFYIQDGVVYNNYLAIYDMVVLGFADLYKGDDIANDNGALDCLDYFINSGKATLFTHDTISYSPTPNAYYNYDNTIALYTYHNSVNSWGKEISKMFRDTVGMDRYDITTDEFVTKSANVKDKNGAQVYGLQGINNMLLYRHDVIENYTTERKTNALYLLYPYNTPYNKTTNNYDTLMTTTKVTKLNDGQVTMFPYHVEDSLTVAETHAQWYGLDMEDDSIVVWYTLDSDGVKNSTYYADSHKDAANNYYIYSKGNITYSGAGHSEMTSEEELKLFVNTIVKAITAGNNVPEVHVVDSAYASGVNNVYVTPYSGNYEFTFYGEDLDLLPYVGRFKTAKVTLVSVDTDGDGDVDNDDRVVYDLGNTLTNLTRITISIGGGSAFDTYADTISKIIDEGGEVRFEIVLTDMYDDAGTATVRLIKRDLFVLD